MLSKGNVSLAEVKRLLGRFWWILPITVFSTGAIGYAATRVLPKKYTSSTMVLVEPPAVDKSVLPTTAQEDLYRHLGSMRDQILSRSRLEPIILKFNIFPKRKPSDHTDDLVEELKKTIDVELIQPMAGSQDKQPPGFHVSVTLADPLVAQQVCAEITSMFMEQNASSQVKKFAETNSFLTQQLDEAQANLNEQDRKLAEFKRMHSGDLPEQEQANLGMLTTMRSQLEANTQAISRAQQDKTFNETLLGQQEASLKATQNDGVGDSDALEKQLAALQDQLSDQLAKYTPEHPDVMKTKAQIEELKRRMASSAAAADGKPSGKPSVPLHESAQIQQLRARIKLDDQSIADLMREQGKIEKDIAAQQGHIQASPLVEQQMKELTRNYQTALDHYNELLKNQQKSAMLTDLQTRQEGETFRVLDAPSMPTSPSFPNKLMFVGGGLGAGFALSAAILYLLALLDKSMYTEADVELCLKLPVLTLVPSFDVSEYAPGLSNKRGKETGVLATKA
jgi:polysaccharide chain length determinant protein (PEP-CTERM system associated)